MLRHLGPVSLFSKVRHPTSLPGSQSVTSVVLFPELLESASWISHVVLVERVLNLAGQQHAL